MGIFLSDNFEKRKRNQHHFLFTICTFKYFSYVELLKLSIIKFEESESTHQHIFTLAHQHISKFSN